MAIVIDMPKLSDTMEEGVIAKWNVKEGDEVKSGDIIAEVETDKATMEVEAFDPGTILKIFAKEGDAVPLGGKMAVIGKEGEDISDLLGDKKSEDKPSKEEAPVEKETLESEAETEETPGKKEDFDPLFGGIEGKGTEKESAEDGHIKASPLAKKMAKEQGIELSNVKGSGPLGRIVKKDIEEYEAPAAQPTATKRAEKDEDVPVSQMRKSIAKRLAESKFGSPHFYETVDIDMKKAVDARTAMNASGDVKISFNDFVVKACAMALRQHPKVNSSWLGETMRRHASIHVAVAVAVDEGLLTPVIRDTDIKGLTQISAETKELAGKARDKKLQPQEWEGSTFTVSNLGMYGIEEFTAIINPPNACILAVGAIRDIPVIENGEIVPGKRMKVTLSSDHRIVDGATSAQFLNAVRNLLENPMNMLL
ncbi:MAG: pyruvate dehydrogenase complex dihydrolipoamide acetyltransferase [Balneolales bacterium]